MCGYLHLKSAVMLIGGKGHDSDELRAALCGKGMAACIPPRAKLKDWKRLAIQYDRCAHNHVGKHLYCSYSHTLSQLMSTGPNVF